MQRTEQVLGSISEDYAF